MFAKFFNPPRQEEYFSSGRRRPSSHVAALRGGNNTNASNTNNNNNVSQWAESEKRRDPLTLWNRLLCRPEIYNPHVEAAPMGSHLYTATPSSRRSASSRKMIAADDSLTTNTTTTTDQTNVSNSVTKEEVGDGGGSERSTAFALPQLGPERKTFTVMYTNRLEDPSHGDAVDTLGCSVCGFAPTGGGENNGLSMEDEEEIKKRTQELFRKKLQKEMQIKKAKKAERELRNAMAQLEESEAEKSRVSMSSTPTTTITASTTKAHDASMTSSTSGMTASDSITPENSTSPSVSYCERAAAPVVPATITAAGLEDDEKPLAISTSTIGEGGEAGAHHALAVENDSFCSSNAFFDDEHIDLLADTEEVFTQLKKYAPPLPSPPTSVTPEQHTGPEGSTATSATTPEHTTSAAHTTPASSTLEATTTSVAPLSCRSRYPLASRLYIEKELLSQHSQQRYALMALLTEAYREAHEVHVHLLQYYYYYVCPLLRMVEGQQVSLPAYMATTIGEPEIPREKKKVEEEATPQKEAKVEAPTEATTPGSGPGSGLASPTPSDTGSLLKEEENIRLSLKTLVLTSLFYKPVDNTTTHSTSKIVHAYKTDIAAIHAYYEQQAHVDYQVSEYNFNSDWRLLFFAVKEFVREPLYTAWEYTNQHDPGHNNNSNNNNTSESESGGDMSNTSMTSTTVGTVCAAATLLHSMELFERIKEKQRALVQLREWLLTYFAQDSNGGSAVGALRLDCLVTHYVAVQRARRVPPPSSLTAATATAAGAAAASSPSSSPKDTTSSKSHNSSKNSSRTSSVVTDPITPILNSTSSSREEYIPMHFNKAQNYVLRQTIFWERRKKKLEVMETAEKKLMLYNKKHPRDSMKSSATSNRARPMTPLGGGDDLLLQILPTAPDTSEKNNNNNTNTAANSITMNTFTKNTTTGTAIATAKAPSALTKIKDISGNKNLRTMEAYLDNDDDDSSSKRSGGSGESPPRTFEDDDYSYRVVNVGCFGFSFFSRAD